MPRPDKIPEMHELEAAIIEHNELLNSRDIDLSEEQKILDEYQGHLQGKKIFLCTFIECI